MVKLHQILSLKYLGFSLAEIKDKLYNMDTPEQVQQILNNQKYIIRDEIRKLENAYEAIDCLEREVKLSQK